MSGFLEELREWGWAVLLVLGVLYMAFRDKLGLDFVRRREYVADRERDQETYALASDLDGVGGRATGAISMATMAKDTADANADRITRLEERGGEHMAGLSRTLTRIDQELRAMDERHRKAQSQIDQTAAILDQITKRLDQTHREARDR